MPAVCRATARRAGRIVAFGRDESNLAIELRPHHRALVLVIDRDPGGPGSEPPAFALGVRGIEAARVELDQRVDAETGHVERAVVVRRSARQETLVFARCRSRGA